MLGLTTTNYKYFQLMQKIVFKKKIVTQDDNKILHYFVQI